MGLDIYLHRYEDLKLHKELELQYEKGSEENWYYNGRDYKELTEYEKDSARQKDEDLKTSLGIIENDSIELPSLKYPDHYFKIGYWRSSYNDGGINRILSNLGLPDLYEIMGKNDNDEYIFKPNWDVCLQRIIDTINQLRQKPNLRCWDVSWNDFKNPNECEITDEESALNVFLKQKKDTHSDAYSNSDGYFFLKEPAKVLGLVHGVKKMLFRNDIVLPCVYVVTEGENEWYIQALEIMQETIEYVLSRSDKDKYYLHWSS